MANGEDNGTTLGPNSPAYMRFAQMVLKTSGFSGLIALALCAFLMWMMSTQMKVIAADIADAKVRMSGFSDQQRAWDIQRERLLEKQLGILRQVCVGVNAGKGDVALKACWE